MYQNTKSLKIFKQAPMAATKSEGDKKSQGYETKQRKEDNLLASFASMARN